MPFDYPFIQLTDFRGAWTRREATDVPPEGALLALNCEFNPGQVSKRRGFAPAWNPNKAITSMFNWVKGVDAGGGTNLLVLYNQTDGKAQWVPLYNLAAVDLFTQAGAYALSCAPAGNRLYVAARKADGTGACACKVADGLIWLVPNVDSAFLGPITAKPSLSDGAAGKCTAGVHRVGYIIETRGGYSGKISPVDANGAFDVSSTINAAGDKQINFSVTTTWPTEASKVWVVMTPTTNLNRYFIVPFSSKDIVGGSNNVASFNIDISDDDLIATGTEVTDNLNLLTAASDGTAPFLPFAVENYGARMIYLTEINGIPQWYASEPDKFQNITADQHVGYLPGWKKITAGKQLGTTFYIFGPHWTYSITDNGDVPALWPAPVLVDGAIGTLSPTGVAVNSAAGLMWVADVGGLYCFSGGQYPRIPVSYECEPDWKRINWAYAHTVQVVDNPAELKVYVIAPLDSATAPSHILVFDYSNGVSSQQVKYSLWDLASGSICMVQNDTTKQLELWASKSTAGKVLRQKLATEATPHNDDGAAIDWQYETAPLPGAKEAVGRTYRHPGVQILVRGAGTLTGTAYGKDRVRSFALRNVTLGTATGKEELLRCDLISEWATVRFRNNAVNEYAQLSALKWFYKPFTEFR